MAFRHAAGFYLSVLAVGVYLAVLALPAYNMVTNHVPGFQVVIFSVSVDGVVVPYRAMHHRLSLKSWKWELRDSMTVVTLNSISGPLRLIKNPSKYLVREPKTPVTKSRFPYVAGSDNNNKSSWRRRRCIIFLAHNIAKELKASAMAQQTKTQCV